MPNTILKAKIWDWQKVHQDKHAAKLSPSFKTINTFAGTDDPTRRKGRHAKIHNHGMHYARSFPCPICDKAFQNADDQLVHVLAQDCTRGFSHLLQINNIWHCLTCDDEDFFNREQAEQHARGHMLGKGMPCPVCSQDFQGEKANDLFRHVKKQHRDYTHNLF